MKIKFLLAFFILATLYENIYAQETYLSQKIQNVIPPSPSVGSLMKFEEIPVGNYTGIPEIKIPIHSGKMRNGEVYNIDLNYHASSINRDQVASECGLGWNLMAGGTISRTVRGFPDEINKLDGSGTTGKIGVFHSNTSGHINRYYQIMPLLANNTLGTLSADIYNEYLWDTRIRGKYDNELDLYQYNFMGYSGRFIIEKNKVDNSLYVIKMDGNPITITNNYNPATFENNSFLITDKHGNRYTFDIVESTTTSTLESKQYYWNFDNNIPPLQQSTNFTCKTAYHLSKIEDANLVVQAEFAYNTQPMIEKAKFATRNDNIELDNSLPDTYQYYKSFFHPYPFAFQSIASVENFTSQNDITTRKLKSITIPGDSKIVFSYLMGRPDTNFFNPQETFKLSEIAVGEPTATEDNIRLAPAKKFVFDYESSTYIDKTRMMLANIKEYGKGSIYLPRNFTYKTVSSARGLHTDPWGYLALGNINTETGRSELPREISSQASTTDVLQKMTLPTGGSIVFDFEPNVYAYEGDVPMHGVGGGIRINAIKHFDIPNPVASSIPLRQVNYSYQSFENSAVSSGSLVYPLPVYTYYRDKKECISTIDFTGQPVVHAEQDFHYKTISYTNNLTAIKTKGSEVGYRNVTVKEMINGASNGRKEFTYSSAQDYPEVITPLNTGYPFLPTKNIDCRRGNLLFEKTFNEQGQILNETETYYSEGGSTVKIGIRFYDKDNYPFINFRNWFHYSLYKNWVTTCQNCPCYFGLPNTFISAALIEETWGYVKPFLISTTEYFYNDNGMFSGTDIIYRAQEYNPYNDNLNYDEVTTSNGTFVTRYYYSYGNGMNSNFEPNIGTMISKGMTGILLETSQMKDNVLLKSVKTNYKNWGNSILMPDSVKISKGVDTETIAPKISLVNTSNGDGKGKILETQDDAGVKTAYIWGYQSSHIIAKIQNASYAQVAAALNISTTSLNGYNEAHLQALDNLRSNSSMAKSMITTYRYELPYGITMITDPRGLETHYTYDDFGKLKQIRDNDGNILSENEYKYRTQN